MPITITNTPRLILQRMLFCRYLEIAVSFDCGDTYEMLFRKGGADLATTPNPIMNPLSIMECFFIPNDNEWKTEVIDLTSYANQEQAIFKFSYISGMGGCINIDNIDFAADANINDVVSEDKVILYPNPAHNQINIKNNTPMDCGGLRPRREKILTVSIQSEQGILDISALQKGVYFLQIQTKQGIIHKKFTKE